MKTSSKKKPAKPAAKAAPKSAPKPAARAPKQKAKEAARPARPAAKKAPASKAPKAPARKAAPAKAKAAPARKPAPAARPTPVAKPAARPAAPPPKAKAVKAAAPIVEENGHLTARQKLGRFLEYRASTTSSVRQVTDEQRKLPPVSVLKARELAEARRKAAAEAANAAMAAAKAAQQRAAQEAEEAKAKRRAAAMQRKPPYSKTELKELEQILLGERERLLRDLQVINELATSNEENMNPTFSNHQADAATDSSALETTLLQRVEQETRLTEINEALQNLANGTYGLCQPCAGDEPRKFCDTCPYIPVARLRAKPFAKLCVPLRREMEKKKGKH